MAKGGMGRVEGDHHSLGSQALAVVQQGLEEAIGHRGGNSFLSAEAPFAPFGEGIETSEGQAVAIDQKQQGRLGAQAWNGFVHKT